ncbi:MAG TPA: hypothetical protein QGF58_30585 [Myxococcota bacterium]|nr:hypothetical protein [Myxococcota bacterium]
MWVFLIWGCGPSEPILPGVPVVDEESVEFETAYERKEGVYVDIQFLGGRSFDEVRGEVSIQLGDIQEVNDLGVMDGTEYVMERGRVKVKDGTIYLVHVDLPRAMRQGPALHATGLPSDIDRPYNLTNEVRLRWHSGFDRIRMGREVREGDMVIWVEALKFDPRDR